MNATEQGKSGSILVLGMHRSGTSCVTGSLVLAGATVGYNSDLSGVSEQNPKGFFERRDLRNFCDILLQDSGADWWKLSSFSASDIAQEVRRRALEIAAPAIQQLEHHQPWIAKDPRFCLLLPLLLELVPNPVCVHIYRNPLEVARSLKERNNIPIAQGIALWELYNQMAIRNSAELPVVRVAYPSLLRNPLNTVHQLLDRLNACGVSGLSAPDPGELLEFVDGTLHRQHATSNETRQFLTESQLQLWNSLRSKRRLNGSHIPPISKSMIAALEDLEWVRVAIERGATLEQARNEKQQAMKSLQRLNNVVALQKEQKRVFRLLRDDLGQVKRTLGDMNVRSRSGEEQIRMLTERIEDLQAELSRLKGALDQKNLGSISIRRLGWFLPRYIMNPRKTRRLYREYMLLVGSELFDEEYYITNNPDVKHDGLDPVLHFLLYGAREGREPSERFCVSRYLEQNKDVQAARQNPLVHYLEFGRREGRRAYPVIPNDGHRLTRHDDRSKTTEPIQLEGSNGSGPGDGRVNPRCG